MSDGIGNTIKKPIDIPTGETADFIASNLAPNVSIAEIGCGEGHVAVELEKRGFRVKGIDSDQEAVDSSCIKGVDAIYAAWPDVDLETVDCVAFTRSLHHVEQLVRAIDRAADVLHEKGMLLVEDFAFSVTDRSTMNWFLDLIRNDRIGPLIETKPDEFATRMLSADDPFAEWQHDKHHDLHSAAAMKQAIETRFDILDEESVPYFYRYLVPVLPDTLETGSIVYQVLEEEKRLGASGEIVLVGRRIVAIKS